MSIYRADGVRMDDEHENQSTDIDYLVKSDEDIIELIQKGDWHEVILGLTQDMNPWDIDLTKLNDRFTAHIKKMSDLDLRIPAKILLAAAIIYRLKSDTLRYNDTPEPEPEELGILGDDDYSQLEFTHDPNDPIVIPPIQIPLRREPRREVGIDELVDALGKAMVIKTRRESRQLFQIDLKGEDISLAIEDIFEKINQYLEKNNLVNFDQLLEAHITREDKLRAFSSILHLSNQGRIVCTQDQMFGEIKIRLNENGIRN